MRTLWQIKNRNCCFGIEPHGCYKLKTKLMFVYYYLNTLNNFVTYYVWIYECDKAMNKNDTREVI